MSYNAAYPASETGIRDASTGLLRLEIPCVQDALSRALQFLRAGQHMDGSWRDFRLDVGESTSWVTGYVACQLGQMPGYLRNDIGDMLRKAVSFLRNTQRNSGGWGYNENVACDCDSTAFASLAMHASGLDVPESAISFLRRHHVSHGIFATFLHKPPLHPWSLGHPEVSATAIAALSDSELATQFIGHVHEELRRFRRLASFWWEDDAYLPWAVTMMAARVHLESSVLFVRPLIQAGTATSPFAHSLLGQTLLNIGEKSDAIEHWQAISNRQKENGAWQPSAGMRYVNDDSALLWTEGRQAVGNIHYDIHGFFTTATVAGFLGMLLSQCGDFR